MITFWVHNRKYIIEPGDRVMDNGKCIQFLPLDETKRPLYRSGLMRARKTVYIGPGDWQRMKSQFKITQQEKTHTTYTL